MEGCQEEDGVHKVYPLHSVRPCIGYGLSDEDEDVVDADECEREGVKCITVLELGIDIGVEESAFDPAEVGSELCPEAPMFKAEKLGGKGSELVVPVAVVAGGGGGGGESAAGSSKNTDDNTMLAEKKLEESEQEEEEMVVPVILDAAKETDDVGLRVLLLHDEDMNPSILITDVGDASHMVSGAGIVV